VDRRQFVLGSASAYAALLLSGCAARPVTLSPSGVVNSDTGRTSPDSFDAEIRGTRLRLVYPSMLSVRPQAWMTLQKATAIIAIEVGSQRPICFGHGSSRPELAFVDATVSGFDRTTAELDLAGLALPAGSYYVHATYLQHITQILLFST